jgi:hypothetical protein
MESRKATMQAVVVPQTGGPMFSSFANCRPKAGDYKPVAMVESWRTGAVKTLEPQFAALVAEDVKR